MRGDKDYTAHLWVDEFTGQTYGEMKPREIIESQIKHCMKGLEIHLGGGFRDNVKQLRNVLDSAKGQYDMLENWLYILHMFDLGQTTIEKEGIPK